MQPRSKVFDPNEVGVYHCFSRCVRRSFLCGTDDYSGKNYDHRKQWLEDLLIQAAECHMIDVLSYAILDNHFHVLLRNRPDLKKKLTPMAVARRWLLLHPKRRDDEGRPCEPSPKEIRAITQDEARVKVLRRRLLDISWFMAFVKERVARQANEEDRIRGTFFEKRFEMRRLLSENAVLACSIYIELNLIRASLAQTPEKSLHTSVWCRIQALKARRAGKSAKDAMKDRWLAPIAIGELPQNQRFADKQWRASDNPGLPITIEQYLQLVDWSGRQVRLDKPGKIPEHLAPILERLGIESTRWIDLLKSFNELFRRIAGTAEDVEQHAAKQGRHWFQGIENCRQAFRTA